MLNNTKQIEVNGKKYTLTAKRSLIIKIASICPELVKLAKEGKTKNEDLTEDDVLESLGEDSAVDAISTLYDNMPTVFYEMIKVAHKDITREKSDEIYLDFYNEYNDVDTKLYEFAQSVFTGGIPREKKKELNW